MPQTGSTESTLSEASETGGASRRIDGGLRVLMLPLLVFIGPDATGPAAPHRLPQNQSLNAPLTWSSPSLYSVPS
jgi:hypothetical protein